MMIKVDQAIYWFTSRKWTNITTDIAIAQWMVMETHIVHVVSPAALRAPPSTSLQELANV